MKSLVKVILIVLLSLSLIGCRAASPEKAKEQEEVLVETTEEQEVETTPLKVQEEVEEEPETIIPSRENDEAAVEQVMREYYEAFSAYDTDRIGSLLAEETRETEGMEILMAVVFAQSLNLKFEVTEVAVSIDGDCATAVVTGESSLGLGVEAYELVRESGSWKIHSKVKETEGTPEAEPADEPEPEPEPIPPTPTTGYSRSSPATISTELLIEQDRLGDVYEYNLTLLEIVRGAKAWRLVEEARSYAEPPPPGFEYLVAKIRFEYLKGPTPDTSILVYGDMFTAVSSEGKEYENPTMAFDPEPSLHSTLYPGASHEGWAVYTVSVQDDKPLLTFGRLAFGGCVWWQLY